MLNKLRQINFKLRLFIVVAAAIALGTIYINAYSDVMQTAYTTFSANAQAMQVNLNGGYSPNWVLTNYYGDWKPNNFSDLSGSKNFAIIKEESKPYVTGTLKIGGEIPSPTQSFLNKVKVSGTNRMLWRPSVGVHVFIQAYTYNYGDVFGYVIVGKSALPYELKLLLYGIVALVVLAIAVCILFLPWTRSAKKQNKTI